MNSLQKNLTTFALIFFLCLGFSQQLIAAEDQAIFAGGCFWCLEHDLENINGVFSAESGYSGGELKNPTYRNHKGHQEVVLVRYDPSQITYEKLLNKYWINIDPFDGEGQFCDRGKSYKPVIFTQGENQKLLAKKSLGNISDYLKVPIKSIEVEIKEANKFWMAEDYHQNFAERNNIKYNFYRYSCGRDKRLNEVWGKDEANN